MPARVDIVRTSWLCGAHGNNIVRTALRLADGEDELRFVDDQHGLADVHGGPGAGRRDPRARQAARHFHATNSGATTWWGFVRAVLAQAGADPAGPAHQARTSSTRPSWRHARPIRYSTTWRCA